MTARDGFHVIPTVVERFWSKVEKTDDGCWNWSGAMGANGYGQLWIGLADVPKGERGRAVYAHRFSYAVHFGEMPEGIVVCHHCDNRRCVRPDHLFLGTQSDNMRDCVAKGRHKHAVLRGEANPQSRLTDDDVRQIRSLLGTMTQKDIAKRFGISATTLGRIKQGICWNHVQDESRVSPDVRRQAMNLLTKGTRS